MSDAMNAVTGEPAASDPGAPEFLSGLSEDNRAIAEQNGWQGVDGVFEGYRSLRDQLGNAVPLPDETAGPDDVAALYSDLSKRWTPENGYQFKMPDTLAEDFPYDQAFAEEAGGWFREAGLPPSAAQTLHDRWIGKMSEQFAAQQEAAAGAATQEAASVERAHQALVREYGDPASNGYQNLVAKADRALSGLKTSGVDLTGWFTEKGALTQADENGLQQVADPTAVKLLAFIHDKALTEDSLADLGDSGSGTNPFDTDRPDLKQQSELLESNPARARQMIISAGRDPGLFRL